MSDPKTGNDDNRPRNPKDYKKPFLTWTELSCIVSGVILAWAFSNAFFGRQDPIFSSRTGKAPTPLVTATPAKLDRAKSEQEMHEAQVQELLVLDDQLMKQAAKFQRRYDVPGERESRKYRVKRTKILQQQAEVLLSELPDGEVEEGTMEWEALQDMKTALDDYEPKP